MKRIFFCITILLLTAHYCQAQTIVTVTRSSTGNENDYLHSVANEFSTKVGSKLKESGVYPAKIKSISVELKNVSGKLQLTYSAEIVSCKTDDAQWYFDHRGACSARIDASDALNESMVRCNEQTIDVIGKFIDTYGDALIVSRNYTDAIKYGSYYWVVTEAFITAPKKAW